MVIRMYYTFLPAAEFFGRNRAAWACGGFCSNTSSLRLSPLIEIPIGASRTILVARDESGRARKITRFDCARVWLRYRDWKQG